MNKKSSTDFLGGLSTYTVFVSSSKFSSSHQWWSDKDGWCYVHLKKLSPENVWSWNGFVFPGTHHSLSIRALSVINNCTKINQLVLARTLRLYFNTLSITDFFSNKLSCKISFCETKTCYNSVQGCAAGLWIVGTLFLFNAAKHKWAKQIFEESRFLLFHRCWMVLNSLYIYVLNTTFPWLTDNRVAKCICHLS